MRNKNSNTLKILSIYLKEIKIKLSALLDVKYKVDY